MNTHTPLYRELYKYTNHAKETNFKKYLARFTFNEPSVDKTDGSHFLNYSNLKTLNRENVKNSRVYFENVSSPRSRSMNKLIKICNIPFSQLPYKKDLINSLNRYLVNKIIRENDGIDENGEIKYKYYCNDIESLGLRKQYWNNNYPDLEYIYKHASSKTNREKISKYLYGLQFNSIEFFEATGILVTVFRSCKQRELNSSNKEFIYRSGKLSNFNNLYDGLNIRISIQSDNTLEIDFTDTSIADNGYEYYDFSYEIDLCTSVKSIEQSEYSDNDIDNALIWVYDRELEPFGRINYRSSSKDSKCEIIEYTEDLIVHRNFSIMTASDKEFIIWSENYNALDYGMNIFLTDGRKNTASSKLIFPDDIKKKTIDYNWSSGSSGEKLKSYNFLLVDSLYEGHSDINHLIVYYTTFIERETTDIKYKMTELADIVEDEEYYSPVKDNIELDEKTIIEKLPFSLQTLLENKSTLKVEKIDKILASSVTLYNNLPCLTYSFNSKHDSVMLFKDNKLLSPTYITNIDDNYTVYIDLSLLCDITNSINDKIYSNPKIGTIDISGSDLYMVYDTDKLFIEDMRYQVKSIYKYFDKSSIIKYSIQEVNGKKSYIEDENGEYIKNNGYYLEIADGIYYLVNNQYIDTKPDNYNGNEYIKVKTNEYLLPINKDIDPNKIVISIEDYTETKSSEIKYRKDINGLYIYLENERLYVFRGAKTYLLNKSYIDTSNLFIKINNEYFSYDSTCSIKNDEIYYKLNETDELKKYNNAIYIKYDPGFIIPPYYYEDDIHYSKVGNKLLQLSNIFNIRKYEDIVAIDSYVNSKDELGNDIIVSSQTYTKKSLIEHSVEKMFNIDIKDNTRYYLSDTGQCEVYNYLNNCDKIYYKTKNITKENRELFLSKYKEEIIIDTFSEELYILTTIVDSYKKEVSQFVNMNKVYKFSLINGEILDGGLANTDEYMQAIEFGKSLSFEDYPCLTDEQIEEHKLSGETMFINIDDKLVEYSKAYESYDGKFYDTSSFENAGLDYLNDEDDSNDYEIYDFNFTSPYTINDSSIKVYRIDSSYSKYFINSDDDFLAYTIPNQLINSDNRMLAFLNGNMTDEYNINKKLFSRLFGDNTIISFSDDPDDNTGNDFIYNIDSEGEYYYSTETHKYFKDPERDLNKYQRKSSKTFYKIDSRNYIECASYDSNDIVDKTLYEKYPDGTFGPYEGLGNSYYKLKNGSYIQSSRYRKNSVTILNYEKYFELKAEVDNSFFISTKKYYEYVTRYSKSISSVYLCNMRNMVLYQNQNGIKYNPDAKIFSLSNDIDSIVRNERQPYKDIYFIPLSTKYMVFFINGKFANGDINIISPTKFSIDYKKVSMYGDTINEIQIYVYDKFLYSLDRYKDYYFTKEDVPLCDTATHQELGKIDYTIYKYNDTLWENYSDYLISHNLHERGSFNYEPKDTGFNTFADLVSLYEIFGKYILNHYDLDEDLIIFDEIKEYFEELFDKDGRMRLELIQDSSKRKFIY